TGVQTCALPIYLPGVQPLSRTDCPTTIGNGAALGDGDVAAQSTAPGGGNAAAPGSGRKDALAARPALRRRAAAGRHRPGPGQRGHGMLRGRTERSPRLETWATGM